MEQNDAGIKATGKLDTGNYTNDSLIRTIWYFGRNDTKHKNAFTLQHYHALQHHAMKVYTRMRSKAPHKLDLDTTATT